MEKILGTNTKLDKKFGKAADFMISGLTLAPHTLGGHNVCEWSTPACRASCVLWFAGHRVMTPVRDKAIRLTQWLFSSRETFIAQLHKEINQHEKKAKRAGFIPAIRLNVASDLDWCEVIKEHPSVVFYDYTKSYSRMLSFLRGELPSNYSITFSASEKTSEDELALILYRNGNIAQVFNTRYVNRNNKDSLPTSVNYSGTDFPVIDADLHDLRLPSVDGQGVVCGLRLKGMIKTKEIARNKGFAK